jgi:uroporphyrinogen III methyltransferase/synthase
VRALTGRRILVTRAREQGEKTAAAIRARGGEPVLLPAIEVHPSSEPEVVAAALARAASYAWVAFTSANGVVYAWRALEGGGRGREAFGGARFAAIGAGTAEALAVRGVRVDVVATESKGEGLAEAMRAAMKPGEAVLLLRARVGREAFAERLRAAGFSVDVVAVYETRPAAPGLVAPLLEELGRGAIDAVTFTSGSTVDSFVGLAGGDERARALLARAVVGSIGPITTAALQEHHLRVDAQADPYTIDGLLAALESHFEALSGA